MRRFSFFALAAMCPFLVGACLLASAQTAQPKSSAKSAGVAKLSEYRTVANAVTTRISKSSAEDSGKTGYLGVAVVLDGQNRLVVEEIQPESPGDKAGIKKGDIVARVGEHAVSSPVAFREWLQTYPADSKVAIRLLRQNQQVDVTASLAATSRPLTGKGGQGGGGMGGAKGGGAGPLTLWQKPSMRLGVVRIEFSDVKHNAKVASKDWDNVIFSKGIYAPGSLNDYFLEQSGGAFHLEGKVFEWVNVGKKRGDYIQGNGTGDKNKTVVLNDALSKLAARDGKEAFKDLDGFVFIYAGDRYKTNAGAIYYPHAGTISQQGQRYHYFLTSEGSSSVPAASSFAKISGLALGLPDLAARTENAGSRGLGPWCAMSNPITNGKPQHFNPWAKEKLGWLKPTVIDPTTKQKLILSPIEGSAKECFKILVRPNGSEYYLVENRRKKGFDADLPGEGLLIWRVLNDRPMLCESHGIDSPKAPEMNLKSVPFPSVVNHAFTPETIPSSHSPLGGGLPVYLTEMRQLADGRVVFSVGYEYR